MRCPAMAVVLAISVGAELLKIAAGFSAPPRPLAISHGVRRRGHERDRRRHPESALPMPHAAPWRSSIAGRDRGGLARPAIGDGVAAAAAARRLTGRIALDVAG